MMKIFEFSFQIADMGEAGKSAGGNPQLKK
jgi:hypothetical protein